MWTALILALVGGLIATCGDIVSKKWVSSGHSVFFFVGLLIYMIAATFLMFSFKHENIVIATVIYILFNILTFIFVSFVFFKEPLNVIQLIGIGIALISMVILEIS